MSIPFLFEPQNLTVLLNFGLICILMLIVLFAAISMLRKVIPQIFHFVFYLVVMIVGICFMGRLANWVGNYDLSSLHQSISYNGEVIPITNLLDTIRQLLEVMAKSEGEKSFLFIAITNGDVTTYIEGLSLMLVAYITFFLYALLAAILCWPISSLIYHCGFKFIFTKKQRKYQFKKKWKSFAIGFVSATISAAMLLTPLTALANSINYGVQKNRTQEGNRLDAETYDNYISWIDAYNDSIFAKFIFGNKGNSLDIMLMDYSTRTDFNGDELLFSDQISTIADTAEKLIALGFFSEGENGFNSSALFGKGVVSTLIKTITDSDFLLKIIPVLAHIALNYAEVNEIMDTTHLSSVADLDWKKQLQQVDSIYTALYDAGLVTDLADDNVLEVGLPNNKELMYQAFDILDETELFQTVIPAILYYYVTNSKEQETTSEELDILSYLSNNWDDYESIKWGSELRIFYDTIMGLEEKFDIQFTVKKDTKNRKKEPTLKSRVFHTGFKTNPILKEETSNEESTKSPLLDILFGEKSNEVIEFLTNYNVEKESFNEENTCFLDSEILMKLVKLDTLLPDVLEKNLKDENGNSYIELEPEERSDLQRQLETMQKDKTHEAIKKEMAYIMRFASYLLDEKQVDLNHPDQILTDETSRNVIKSASTYIDKSYLLKTIVPSLFENVLKDVDFGEDIPLKGADFNFKEDIVFGDEIPLLLDAYEDILSVSEAMKEPTLEGKLTKLDTNKLASALHNIQRSKIINPESKNNENFEKILDVIFNNDDMKQMGIYSDSNVNYDLVKNWDVEIDAIAEVFTSIQKGDFIDLLTSEGDFSIQKIKADNIVDLFRSVDDSILLKNTFGTVLDKNLKSALQIDDDLMGITFKNVTSWEEEGANLKAVIEEFQKLDENADLSTIDWLNSDTERTHDLIQAVANMQLFQDPTDENNNYFGSYIHRLLTSNQSGLEDYLKDYPSTGEATFNTSKEDFSTSTWKSTNGETTEVDYIVSVLSSLQEIGKSRIALDSSLDATKPGTVGLDALSSGDMNAEEMRSVIESLSDSNALRMITINGISSALKGDNSPLKLGSINLDDINIRYLKEASKEERKTELLKLPDAYETIESLDLTSGSIQDLEGMAITELLNILHDSHLFNSFEDDAKNVTNRTDLTVFEQVISYLFEESTILDYVTEATETEERKLEFKQIVLDIKNNLCGTSSSVTSEQDGWVVSSKDVGEIARIQEVIDHLTGIDTLSGNALLNITTAQLQGLLKSMNHSKTMHKAVYKFYDESLKAIGFDAFLNLSDLDYKLIDYTGNKEEQHDREIDLFVNLIQEARVEDTIDAEGNPQVTYFDFEHEDIKRWVQSKESGGDEKSSVPFFSLLSNSQVIHYKSTSGETDLASAVILYNVLKKTDSDKYISGTTEVEKLDRIESFFQSPYTMSDQNEGESLNHILRMMDDSVTGSFDDISSNETLTNSIYKIMLAAYNHNCLDENENVIESELQNENRAYLTSEIVANYLKSFDPTQNESETSRRIQWIKSGVDGAKDEFNINATTAKEIQSLFQLKKSYNALINEESDINKENFRLAARTIDTHQEKDGMVYDEVLGKLVYSMFDNTICQEKYSFTFNGVTFPEMTLNEFFSYTNDSIEGLKEAATTYEQKAVRIEMVADQLR